MATRRARVRVMLAPNLKTLLAMRSVFLFEPLPEE
jgi:hypothetical protein